MKEITQRERLKGVLANWKRQYCNSYPHEHAKITESLEKLDFDSCTKKDIDLIIGNSIWTDFSCDECGKEREKLIRFEANDSTKDICEKCLRSALEYLK